jgi:hypothetical protein
MVLPWLQPPPEGLLSLLKALGRVLLISFFRCNRVPLGLFPRNKA